MFVLFRKEIIHIKLYYRKTLINLPPESQRANFFEGIKTRVFENFKKK